MNNEINHNYQYSNKKEGLIFFLFYVLYAFKTLLLLIPLNDPLVDFTKNFINAFLLLIMGWALLYLNKKYWFLLFLFGCLFVISIVIKGNNGLYNYLVLIVILGLTRDISLKYILGVIISSNLIIFLLVLPFIFIAGKFYSIDIRYNQERFTLGFGSPNTMSQYLIMLYLSISSYVYKYLKGKGIYFVLSTVFFIIFSYIIYLSISRTGLGLMFISYVGVMISGFYSKNKIFSGKMVSRLYLTLLTLIIASQVWMVVNFSKYPITYFLNGVLSGRLRLSNTLYNDSNGFPIIFGLNVEPYLPIDFNFMKMFFSLGLIVSFVMLFFLIKAIRLKNYTPIGVVVLLIGLLSSFTESYFAVFFLNISLLFVFSKNEEV